VIGVRYRVGTTLALAIVPGVLLGTGLRPPAPPTDDTKKISAPDLALTISQRGLGKITHYEVGGWAYYNKYLKHATYPGGASGPTIGIGYDLGWTPRSRISSDWKGLVPDGVLAMLMNASGVKSSRARAWVRAHGKSITISQAMALEVFRRRTLPRFTALTKKAFTLDDADTLHAHSNSALVSLVFNRGSSMASSDRRLEMRQIRFAIQRKSYDDVPPAFRRMKRLWVGKNLDGLLARRDDEAVLFEAGLFIMRKLGNGG
jgi:GH24 family phage-related lysozyme (muramidase)